MALMFLAYGACVIPWGAGGAYGGTVVDGATGKPIEGAVIVVLWTKCRIYEMDGCGVPHSLREAVTDSSGEFSISAVPGIDWNPLTYLNDWPEFLIYAVDYLPLFTGSRAVPGSEGNAIKFEQAMRREPRIPLKKPERAEELRRYASGGVLCCQVRTRDTHHLARAVDEQRKRLRMPPLRKRSWLGWR